MNPHTPKWIPTLGVGVLMDFWIFRKQLQGSKFIGLKISLYHWKALGTSIFEMGLHIPFEYFKHKLWLKERPGLKLPISFLTTQSLQLPWFTYVKMACHIFLESFKQGLQLFFKPHLNCRSTQKVMGLLNRRSLETKWHLGVGFVAKHRDYYKGEGGGLPQVQAMVNLVNSCMPMVHPCTKSVPTTH
jgi:hypothetical protein